MAGRRPSVVVCAAAVIAAASCGGADQSSSATTTAEPSATAVSTTTTVVDVSEDLAPTTTEAAAPVTTEVMPATTELVTVEVSVNDPGPRVRMPSHDPLIPTATPTGFATDVAPILLDHCSACHNPGGPGSPHWNLSQARDVTETARFLSESIATGYMPPWPATALSVPMRDTLSLSDEEMATVLGWLDAGAVLDVEPDTPMLGLGTVDLDETDLVVPPTAPYDNESGRYDDYRCMVYRPEITEQVWLRGLQFVPQRTEVVHHAIGYLVPAEQWSSAEMLDDADDGSGWECYGGTGLRDDTFVLGWAPGQLPEIYPEGTGLVIQPGDFFVIQVHYHYDVRVEPDASWLELDIEPADTDLQPISINTYLTPAEIPCGPGESGPLCDRDTVAAAARAEFGLLPADFINMLCGVTPADFADMVDGVATSTCDLPVQNTGEIIAVLGHMHELGARYRMTLNPDTDDAVVLLDIDNWDYDWQYNYRPADRIVLEDGDVVRIECTWERSRRDPRLEPAYVLWSLGSNDEMCFSTITTRPV